MKKTLIIATLALASSAAYADNHVYKTVNDLIRIRDESMDTREHVMEQILEYGYVIAASDAIPEGEDGTCKLPDLTAEKLTDLVISGLKEEKAYFQAHPRKFNYGELDGALGIRIVLGQLYPCKK